MEKAEIKDRIREAMELRELTQSELSEKAKIDKGQLSSYLSGKYKPRQRNIEALAKTLNVDEAWLMGFDSPMEPQSANVSNENRFNSDDERTLILSYRKLNDKNKKKWYSYTSFDTVSIERFMQNQLDGNLALRGIFEPGYANLGTAWSGHYVNLDYMTQMGGVALLDYAYRFSNEPEKYINYGYNSLLASWALMNTGTQQTGFGYWYQGKENDGAVGWAFSPYQNSRTYMGI